MNKNQDDFLKELLNDFKIEASEHYQAIIDGLITMEKNKDAKSQQLCIETIFREVHSLKGASRAVNLLEIEKLCMNLENVFNSLKKGEAKLFPPMIDVFYKATDLLSLLLNDVNEDKNNQGKYNMNQIIKDIEFVYKTSLQLKTEPIEIKTSDNIITIQKPLILDKQENPDEEVFDNPEVVVEDIKKQQKDSKTVRISTVKLNHLLQQSEELISIKSTFEYFSKELQNINFQYALWNKKTNEKNILTQQAVFNESEIKESLASDKDFKKKHEDELYQLQKEMIKFQRVAARMVDELLLDIKSTLLFPFSSMLGIFPKIVRDLSKEYSKNIEIEITGDNIEIDRRILEEIKDPLIHLIRNCIDHGIENDKERKLKEKSPKGKIEINIVQNIDHKIELHIKDDGAGINKSKIINSALKLNIIKPNEVEKLSDKEIHALIFSSGISTSPYITDISGRGLGMAIVAEKVSKLGGTIEMETIENKGTTFIITLPQTIATFRGVLVKTAEQYFIIPSVAVEQAIRIQYSQIKTVESRKTINYRNETLALATLSDVLKISTINRKKSANEFLQLIILHASQKRIAIIVDEILGEQEGIVKDLGLQLSHVNNITGATILGSGKVVPILHPSELIDSASNSNTSLDYSYDNISSTENIVQKSILVAEDSITIRTLLRNFIENAGFKVKTAVDGMEAYNFLQNENFDLLVSDIEMPRMNGFELTAKVRDDKKHSDMPIILVTALETQDDKQRGMEVGANAYIIKSSFESSNLIETIQRLI